MIHTLGFRITQLVFALLQNGLVGGILFGWASIDRTLLIASKEDGGAGLTTQQTTLIFTWASSVSMGASLVLGILLDVRGPRTCSVVACIIVALGSIVMAHYDGYYAIVIGMCLVAFGGPGVVSSIIHISNLFPKHEYMVMSTLTGSIAISFSVFAIFDMIWEQHETVAFQDLFGYYSFVVVIFAVAAFFIYPDEPFEKIDLDETCQDLRLDEHETTKLWHEDADLHGPPQTLAQTPSLHIEPLKSFLRDEHKMALKSESFMISQDEWTKDRSDKVVLSSLSLKDRPFIDQLRSGTFIRALLVFTFCCFSANFSIASISTELNDTNIFSLSVQHDLTRDFTFIMSIGTIASIFAGSFIDHFGVVTATVVTLLLGQLEMLTMIFAGDHTQMMELSFYIYTVFRQFLYPVFIACLTDRLGFKYFGVLLGTGFAVGGVVQLFQATLIDFVQKDNRWNALHWTFFIIFGMLLISPVLDARDNKVREEKIRRAHALHKGSPKVNYGT